MKRKTIISVSLMRELESGKRSILDQNDGERDIEGLKQQTWQQTVSHSRGWLYTHLTTEIWNPPVFRENWESCFSRRSLSVVLHKRNKM